MRTRWALALGACCTWTMAFATTARAQAPAGDTPPAATDGEDEGPFAPKGRTGRLRKTEVKVDEPEEVEHEKPRGAVKLDTVLGFGKIVQRGQAGPDATAFSFVLGGGYRLGRSFRLGLRLPLTTASVTSGLTGKKESGTALGNVELAAAYIARLGTHTELPIELGLALPTASGDAFDSDIGKQRAAAVNEAAAQSRAFEENALFAPHRFGVVPKVSLEYEKRGLAAAGFTKLQLMFKAGGGSAPEGSRITTNSLSLVSVTGGEVFYDVVGDKLAVGSRAWIALLAKDTIDIDLTAQQESPSKVQLALEPGVRAKLGRWGAGLSYIAPLGGQLGGNMSGVRLLLGGSF